MCLSSKLKLFFLSLAYTVFLSACGGGGDGGGSSNTNQPPPPPPPVTDASVLFSDATDSSGIEFIHGYLNPTRTDPEMFAGGAASGDYDNDGDIDLFVVRGDVGPNQLYRNDGNNVFTEVGEQAGLAYTKSNHENYRLSGPTFADIDGDGDLDLFIGGLEGDPSFLFENNGEGAFFDITEGSGIDTINKQYTVSAAFGDYDLDGDLDMALGHWGEPYTSTTSPGDTQHLWRNDSSDQGIKFTSVSIESGIASSVIIEADDGAVLNGIHDYSFTPTFADINQDLYPDLLLVSDFGTTVFFENNRNGSFTNITAMSEVNVYSGMGSSVADYDNDGDLDWFITAIYDPLMPGDTPGNGLYSNNGSGQFTDVTESAGVIDGVWGWGACFSDFDNDGWLDIYHTNGWENTGTGTNFDRDPSRLFMATGEGTFSDKAASSNILDFEQGRAVVCDDFDNDGDIDVFVTHRNLDNSATLYQNDSTNPNSYLKVKLTGLAPNTSAVGAKIAVTTGDVTQIRYVSIGNNFTSHNSTIQHFGLNESTNIDELEITWPNGNVMTIRDVSVDQLVTYTEQ